jgi:streptogramin lyase
VRTDEIARAGIARRHKLLQTRVKLIPHVPTIIGLNTQSSLRRAANEAEALGPANVCHHAKYICRAFLCVASCRMRFGSRLPFAGGNAVHVESPRCSRARRHEVDHRLSHTERCIAVWDRARPGWKHVVTEFPVSKSGDEKCIIAGKGVLWFASNQSRLIGKISTSGHATTYTAPGIAPYCVALGSDATVWFTDTASVAIGRLNAISGHIVEFKLANSSSVPLEIAKGRDGNVWFSDGGLGMVGKVTPTGSITEYALLSGSSSSPYGIAEGPDGAIYVGEVLAGNIARVTTAGAITEYHVGTVSPAALSQGPDRQIWFTGSTATSPDGIERFIVATHKVQPIAIPPNGARALATAPGPDSDVWFTAEGQSANQNYIGLLEY